MNPTLQNLKILLVDQEPMEIEFTGNEPFRGCGVGVGVGVQKEEASTHTHTNTHIHTHTHTNTHPHPHPQDRRVDAGIEE